jgi:uncharacterized protein YraI
MRQITLVILIASMLFIPVGWSVMAQDSPDAWSLTGLNLRTGPNPDYNIVVVLPPNTGVYVEGHKDDFSWVLVHTENGIFRGWVSSGYLRYREGFTFESVPATDEIITELAAPPNRAPVMAVVSAWARADVDVRIGPHTGYPSVYTLPSMTGLVLEGRNTDGSWVLGHTSGGTVRGWVASNSLYFRQDLDLTLVAVLDQMLPMPIPTATALPTAAVAAAPPGPAPAAPTAPPPASSNVTYPSGGYNHSRVASINLNAYPVVPTSMGQARAIFQRGKARGVNPNVVAKVGDCASALDFFLTPFGQGNYNLGQYGSLQDAITYFDGSLTYGSLAASTGFVAGAVLDSTWADPAVCQAGESPLLCEYRIHHPAVAVIMFGTQDVFLMSAEQYDSAMREIVRETIDAGIIPILSTFPSHLAHWDNTIHYNQIVVSIALDFNVPLVNLWLALEALPNHGLEEDGNHLSNPITHAGDLTGDNLDRGWPMRNLVTLQALDAVWRNAMY